MSINVLQVKCPTEADAKVAVARLELREGRRVSIIHDVRENVYYVESPPSHLIRNFERLIYVTEE